MSESNNIQTTKEDFDTFCGYCKKFVNEFGLTDWKVYFVHEPFDAMAECRTHDISKFCIIALSSDWGNQEVTQEGLERVAYHEVIHLLLADIDSLALRADMSRTSREIELSRAYHAVIRRMENLRFGV